MWLRWIGLGGFTPARALAMQHNRPMSTSLFE
jgi:hypothetical protein